MSQNEEDDATFWSRLISEPDRPQDELLAPLGPRAARNKQQQQQPEDKSPSPPAQGSRQLSQRYSEELPDSGGGIGRVKPKKARRPGKAGSRVSDKPGAPVEGAVLRIDRWPLEAAEGGKVGCGFKAGRLVYSRLGAGQMLLTIGGGVDVRSFCV